jgi:hypothetical protein
MARRATQGEGQNIIKNMGLFWDSNNVRWRGNRGIGEKRLIGRRATAKRGGEVNFWDQTGIYALYAADYRLVYVGQAGLTDQSCLGDRIKTHLSDNLAGRWRLFSWFGLQGVRTTDNELGKRAKLSITRRGDLANVLEGIVIEIAEPPMNSQRGRFGRKVERYLQKDEGPKPQLAENEKIREEIGRLQTSVQKKTKQIMKAIHRAAG